MSRRYSADDMTQGAGGFFGTYDQYEIRLNDPSGTVMGGVEDAASYHPALGAISHPSLASMDYEPDGASLGDGASSVPSMDDATSVGPARLYVICESALPRPSELQQGMGGTATPEERARRATALEEAWQNIREWLRTHPDPGDRAAAASYQNQFLLTPLHMVCKLVDPPADIVEGLVRCRPEIVRWADTNGWLPLHYACMYGASLDVLNVLVKDHPETKITQDVLLRTPLHFAVFRSADVVRMLADGSDAAELTDEQGMLPIHYACAYGTNKEVLEALVEAFPDSIVARDRVGRTPFHLAVVNSHRLYSPSVIHFLLSHRGEDMVNVADRSGNLPIHLFANSAAKFRPDQTEERRNASSCLKMYLDAKPKATAGFLTAVQSLPEWLKEIAVLSSHIQNILNEKIGKRFPTSILMLDFYVLMMIIVCFSITSREYIDNRFDGTDVDASGLLVAVFVGGVYFFARESIQMMSLWSLGLIRSYFTDYTNWLDLSVIGFVLYFAIAMAADVGSDAKFRTGVAFTQLILWASVIRFLKSTLVDFAVFVGGVIYVVRRLVAFLIALGVFIFAFAQMFLMVFTDTSVCTFNDSVCTDGGITNQAQLCYTNFPHCTFLDSLLKVYTMLLGEIGDENRYSTSTISQILYILYAFLVVILLSNVLIAIVTDSYGVIKNDRAAVVFWSNRLDFVAEMDVISSRRKKFCSSFPCSGDRSDGVVAGAPTHVDEGMYGNDVAVHVNDQTDMKHRGFFSDSNFRDMWDNLMSLFDSISTYDPGERPMFEVWWLFFFRAIAVSFIVFVWLPAGLFTIGLLWPPQVREWLLVQKKTAMSRADVAEQVSLQINQLKDELNRVRFDLKGEINNDNRELNHMKDEMDALHTSVMSDLQQVKEFMTTLLQLGRSQAQAQEEHASAAVIAAATAQQGEE